MDRTAARARLLQNGAAALGLRYAGVARAEIAEAVGVDTTALPAPLRIGESRLAWLLARYDLPEDEQAVQAQQPAHPAP